MEDYGIINMYIYIYFGDEILSSFPCRDFLRNSINVRERKYWTRI